MQIKEFQSEENAGERIDKFLTEKVPELSRSYIQKLIKEKNVKVNSTVIKSNYKVAKGDQIQITIPDLTEPDILPENIPLDILYEDDYLLAVDKPAGMLIHPSRARNEGTLANFVLGYYRRTGQKCAFHPMTRLDRDTFGIVLLGKNTHVHALLQASQVQKTYHALVYGGPAADSGIIDAPIDRRPLPSLLRFVGPEGKSSVTEYRVLERRQGISRLALRPITGRTHQLRVHCAYGGFPILGDPQYGSEESQSLSARLGLASQQLCAHSLDLTHPITEKALHLESRMDVTL